MQNNDTNRENYIQLTFEDIEMNAEHFGNRKDLLDTMTVYGASLYLAACISEMDKDRLTDADYWYEYLSVEVDDNGEELENEE